MYNGVQVQVKVNFENEEIYFIWKKGSFKLKLPK